MITQNSLNITTDLINDERRSRLAGYKDEFTNVGKLRFSPNIEDEFVKFRTSVYLKQDKLQLTVGALLYSLFVVGDFALLLEPLSYYSAAIRIGITFLMLACVYFVIIKQNTWLTKYAPAAVAGCMTLAGLHLVLMSALSPFPYDYQFLIGLISILITLPILLRLNTRLCAAVNIIICLAVFIFLFFVPADRTITSEWQAVNQILTYFPYAFTGFLVSVGFVGVYLSYFFERMFRLQWLEKRIGQLESESLQELTDRFKLISRQDELTQIPNRRYFFEKATHILEQYKRLGASLSLIILDVDVFKKYNDHYGHLAGDICLRDIAQSLQASCQRSTDIIARYGGEEFVVLLTNNGKQTAMEAAEVIRKGISDLNIPHEKSPFGHITVSLGVTNVVCDMDTRIEQIIECADLALYQAKNNGRNQVAYANSDMLSQSPNHTAQKSLSLKNVIKKSKPNTTVKEPDSEPHFVNNAL